MKVNWLFAGMLFQMAATLSLQGQSSFWLVNRLGGTVDAPVYDSTGAPLQGPHYVAELWGGLSADSLSPAMTYYTEQRIILPFFAGAEAGYFRDEYTGRDSEDDLTVFGVLASDLSALQVRAWDSRLAATYEEAEALGLGGYGESTVFFAKGTSPGLLFNAPANLLGLESFSLRPVIPEPSTWSLLVLGSFGLCVFRRRCRQVPRRIPMAHELP